MELGLKGKRVLITGGSKGIGLAVAKAFAGESARVAINSSRQENLERACADIGGEILPLLGDVASPKDVEHMFSVIEEQWGGIDIMVNNAGIMLRKLVCEATLEEYDHMMNVNLRGTWLCCKYAAELMKKSGGGVILNTSSNNARIPIYATGIYSASKAAVNFLTYALAGELAPYHIRVNAYMPGFIPTDLNAPRRAKAKNPDDLVKNIALRRFGQPEEMANVVLFLTSDQSSYLTGVSLPADGGKYAIQNPWLAWENM